jgi:hypothetical protein
MSLLAVFWFRHMKDTLCTSFYAAPAFFVMNQKQLIIKVITLEEYPQNDFLDRRKMVAPIGAEALWTKS